MSEIVKNSNNFIGYEYKEVTTDNNKASQYIDGYANFGWILDENVKQAKNSKKVSIQLKRDRKMINRVELTRLQQHFEDCMSQIEVLEKSKTSIAKIAGLVTGLLGTIFITCATFAVVHEPPKIWLCAAFAIPGFISWIMPYFIFRAMVRKRISVVNPLIEDKYDEIYEICEKGSRLLESQ